MSFNPRTLLEDLRIPYTEKSGNLYCRCPFCASSDPSQHMGIRLDGERWGCWRNPTHRGKSPARLIHALTGWTFDQVEEFLAQGQTPAGTISSLRDRARSLGLMKPEPPRIAQEEGPPEFRPVVKKGLRKRFWTYLERRGFDPEDVEDVVRLYRLRCALTGRQAGRLILPFFVDHRLVGWTGRAIVKAQIRYLTHPSGAGTKRHVFNYDPANRIGGRVLVLVEGPLDALKLDFYGREYGVRVVACLGVTLTDEQRAEILKLAANFDRVCVLLDATAGGPALRLRSSLPGTRAFLGRLPQGVKDPGDLTPSQARRLARSLARRAA